MSEERSSESTSGYTRRSTPALDTAGGEAEFVSGGWRTNNNYTGRDAQESISRSYKGFKCWHLCIIGFLGVAMIGALALIVCSAIGYSNTNMSGSTKCTEYEVLTTETILCGKGDSCSASGVDISVDGKYSPDQAIKTWLVPQNNLKFQYRQLEPVHFQGNLSSNVLFDSIKHYSWRNSVISGNCCITNEGNVTTDTTLEIFSSFNAAIQHPGTDDPVFTETIYIPTTTTSCFQKWGLNTPFVTQTDGYFFFALSTSSVIRYKIEIATKQVYVNATQYSDPQYFTSRNHSQFSYEKCFDKSGLHKELMDYTILCQATAEDLESDSLKVLACPNSLSLHVKKLWLTVLVVLPFMLVVGVISTVCICYKRKPCEKMTQAIRQQSVDETSKLVIQKN